MKLFRCVLLLFVLLGFETAVGASVSAQTTQSQPQAQTSKITPVVKQTGSAYTNYRDCIRLYKLPFEKLFYLALSSVNENKFEIVEMQSRNGYILFEAEGREFLLTVMKKDKNFTFLRLTPADNNYYFSPFIPQKIFRQVDVNFNTEVKELKF